MTAFATSKRYHAFGEESNYPGGGVFEKHSRLPKAAHPSVSERSFGSDSSKWSVMRYHPSAQFDEHIAGGVGDSNSVRSDMTDNLLNELDDLMPATVPDLGVTTEPDHPRQIRLYLARLEAGLPTAIDIEERECAAVVRFLRQALGFDVPEGPNVLPEVDQLFTTENIKTTFRRVVQLSILIALAFTITTLPQAFGVDVPNFFMHAVFLLVVALIATVVMI